MHRLSHANRAKGKSGEIETRPLPKIAYSSPHDQEHLPRIERIEAALLAAERRGAQQALQEAADEIKGDEDMIWTIDEFANWLRARASSADPPPAKEP